MLNWFGDKQRYFYCLLTHTDTHGDTLRQAHGVWLTRSRSTRQPAETIDFRILNCERQRRSEAPLEKRTLVSHYQHSFAGSHCLSVLSLSLSSTLSLSRSLLSSFIVYVVVVVVVVRLTNFGSVCIRNQFATLAGVQMCECWAVCVCVLVRCVCLDVWVLLNVCWQGSFQYPIFVYHFTTTGIYCTCSIFYRTTTYKRTNVSTLVYGNIFSRGFPFWRLLLWLPKFLPPLIHPQFQTPYVHDLCQ